MVKVHTPNATGQRVRVRVNKTQEQLLNEYVRFAHYCYNLANEHRSRVFHEQQRCHNDQRILNWLEVLAQHKPWLKAMLADEVGAEVAKLAILHNTTAFNRYRKCGSTKSRMPKPKGEIGKRAIALSAEFSGLRLGVGELTLPCLGRLRLVETETDLTIPAGATFHRLTIHQDPDGTWWVSTSYDPPYIPATVSGRPQGRGVGIDLNLDNIAWSDGEDEDLVPYPEVRDLDETIRRCKKRLSRVESVHLRGRHKCDSKAVMKTKRLLAKSERRRREYLVLMQKAFVATILGRVPAFIVLEGADNKGLRPMDIRDDLPKSSGGRYAAGFRRAAANGWRSLLVKQAEEQGILVYYAPKHFPSTKRCSCCGNKQAMPTELRTYECPECGLELARDINAARNLALYGEQVRNEGVANALNWALNSGARSHSG